MNNKPINIDKTSFGCVQENEQFTTHEQEKKMNAIGLADELRQYYSVFEGFVWLSKHETMLRTIPALEAEIEELKQCLRLGYDDTMDYLTINKLGGENNHWLVLTRKLLK
jgi:hypothetical protein